jgi:hypothetical protein
MRPQSAVSTSLHLAFEGGAGGDRARERRREVADDEVEGAPVSSDGRSRGAARCRRRG